MLLICRAAWEIWFNQSKALPRSGFVSQTSIGGETSGSVAKWRPLFSQVTDFADRWIFFWLELNFALGLVNVYLRQFLWELFLFCFCENSFLRRAKKTQTRKNRKNDIPCPVVPRYIKGPRDLGFVISTEVVFHICCYYWGKENRSSFVPRFYCNQINDLFTPVRYLPRLQST